MISQTLRTSWLVDSNTPIINSLGSDFSWQDYNNLQDQIESLLTEIYGEVADVMQLSDYSLSLADNTLDQDLLSTRDLISELSGFKAQADHISAQAIPLTGGQYTRLISESFSSKGVRDSITSFLRQPVVLSESLSTSCPARSPLEINSTTQTLRLRKEGSVTAFSGIPSGVNSIGGRVFIDKIYGTPVQKIESVDSNVWELSVASRSPLARGFSFTDSPYDPWIPDTYQGGSVVRLQINLDSPSPVTELRLRSALLPSGLTSQLLETISSVSSRPNPVDLTGHPTRALNQGFLGAPSLGAIGWNLTPGTVQRWIQAPDRDSSLYTSSPSSVDYALAVQGQAYTKLIVNSDSYYILRYRAFCPGGISPIVANSSIPPTATFISVYYYSSNTPVFGTDSPLHIDTFRDPYPLQGVSFAGAESYVKLLKTPKMCQTAILLIGTDPLFQSNLNKSQSTAEIAYSDVWFCDEALVHTTQESIPGPIESNLVGPGGINSFIEQSTVPSLIAPLGNFSGGFIITNTWVVLSQLYPIIDSVNQYTTIDNKYIETPELSPYSLSLPTSNHDPLVLHQARYSGSVDVSKYRLSGRNTEDSPQTFPSLFSRLGGLASVRSRSGVRDALPYDVGSTVGSYWKRIPGESVKTKLTSLISILQNTYPKIWSTIVNLGKANRSPRARTILLLSNSITSDNIINLDTSSLYVYTLGLSTLELIREEYSTSGLYITKQVGEIGNISGEIRELGVLLDPPLITFGNRLRLWVVPDSKVLEGTSQDSPTALLSRAIPLDSTNPRVSFHSTSESMTGVIPAKSDIVTSWNNLGKVLSQPAFAATPALYIQVFQGGIPVDQSVSGAKLDYIPYINRESIYKVTAAISSGSVYNPSVFDPNALRPIVDLISDPVITASGAVQGPESLMYVTGYRPVSVRLKLPNGAVILPDALGKPRQNEIVFSGIEVLQEASQVDIQNIPSDPAVYAHQTSNSQTQLAFNRSFSTSHSPIASGVNGAALTLFWHKSADFYAASGGVVTTFDVQIPSSDYIVNTQTGQITVKTGPPHNWSEYDQVTAKYFWEVGNISPREWFPPPGLDTLYTPFTPYIVGQGVVQPTVALYQPLQDIPGSPILSGELLTNYDLHLNNPAVPATAIGGWLPFGKSPNFRQYLTPAPGGRSYWSFDNPGEGTTQSVAYSGPGTYSLGLWTASNVPSWPVEVTIQVMTNGEDPITGAFLEQYQFVFNTPNNGTTNLPCLTHSPVDSSLANSLTPPDWFPIDASWNTFKSTLSIGTQTYYQWPSYSMVPGDNPSSWIVSTDSSNPPIVGSTPDNITTFEVTQSSSDPGFPFSVNIPFKTAANPAYRIVTTIRGVNGDDSHGESCIGWTQCNLITETPTFTKGCKSPYVYDSSTNQCVLQLGGVTAASGDVSSGIGAGVFKSISDLFTGTYTQQSYPVTRNVTNYSSSSDTTLTPVNMDPLSPDYYPVFEYKIEPGGIFKSANDLSILGPYSGTDIEITYEYLDISPRIILEIVPEGETSFDIPKVIELNTTRPVVSTPEINSLNLVLNVRS